ncbi:MAG: ATP-binding protein [Longimicrobiales bacterium]|nr:ATP-binding protein [Longimicrobiales bacterium]
MRGLLNSARALPALVTGLLAVGSVFLWQALNAEQDRLVAGTSLAMAGGIATEITSDAEDRRQALARMAHRWRELGRPQRSVWLADASLYVMDGVTPEGLLWLDDSLTPRWFVDDEGRPQDASSFEAPADLERTASLARQNDRQMLSAVIVEGSRRIAAIQPLTAQGAPDGHLVGLFDASDLFGLPFGAGTESFHLRLTDERGETVYESGAMAFQGDRSPVVTRDVDAGAGSWLLEITPSETLLAGQGSPMPEIVLALGLGLALLAGWALLIWQRGARSAQELEHFHSISVDGLCIADFDGRFHRLNPALSTILQRSEDELLATPFLELVHPDDVDDTVRVMGALGEGSTVISFENRYRMGDGTYRWISWNAAPSPSGDRIYAIARDVTEKRELVDELSRARDESRERARKLAETAQELARSNEDLQQFAYVASHDLQEPLRMVAGYTELLAKRYKGKLDDDADQFIDFAVDGAHRMKDLISSLLAFSRVHSQGADFEPIDLEAVMQRVRRDLARRIAETGAEITSDPLPTVHGDEVQLGQLLQNLVANALKFASPDVPPRIHVAAVRQADEWHISVQDNGIGIDARHTQRIFEIFQRLHGRGQYSGTGIGLAICKRIVHRHGGRIWVESEPGKGSTFHFTLADSPAGNLPKDDEGAAA